MRTIKFRLWCKSGSGNFKLIDNNSTRHWKLEELTAEGGILMQYTGIKDKNGIEIYEGDIIVKGRYDRKDTTYPTNIFIVFWNNNRCAFNLISKNAYPSQHLHTDQHPHLLITQQDKYEVIGNVYENPDLLK